MYLPMWFIFICKDDRGGWELRIASEFNIGLCLDMEKFWPLRTFDALCLTSFQCFQAFLLNKAHKG